MNTNTSSIIITSSDFSQNINKTTIPNINPNASDANLLSFAQDLIALTADSYVSTVRNTFTSTTLS